MRSSYKKIGSFVKQVTVRNKDLSVTNLQGININKFFMPSVANTNGTDLSKYKVVAQKQFAFNPMHVGRDEVLPISMLEEEESVIVSPAYVVFKVKDETQLLPEYLMMWCRRPEFDRNAWFTTDSSVRGGFSWEDFCDLTLPVPTIDKQREIVREYHTIVDRIKLNERLNQKLEETAQAIYKQWFVDFEFPISKEHATEIGKLELEGKPYKSSGGKMVWNDELDQEIPEGWGVKEYVDIFNFKTGKLNSNAAVENGEFPFFTCSSETFKTNTYSFECEALVLAGNNASAVYPFKYFKGKFDAYQRTYVITVKDSGISIFQGYFEVLGQLEGFKGTSSGTATKFLTMKILNPIKMVAPHGDVSGEFSNLCSPIFIRRQLAEEIVEKLTIFKEALLVKMTKAEATA